MGIIELRYGMKYTSSEAQQSEDSSRNNGDETHGFHEGFPPQRYTLTPLSLVSSANGGKSGE